MWHHIEKIKEIRYLCTFFILFLTHPAYAEDFSISMTKCLMISDSFENKERLVVNTTDNWVFTCVNDTCKVINAKNKEVIFENKTYKSELNINGIILLTDKNSTLSKIYIDKNKKTATSFNEELLGNKGIRSIICSGKLFLKEDLSKFTKPQETKYQPKPVDPSRLEPTLIGE